MRAGTFTLAAPIKFAGTVLSHPASITTPSIGLARMVSSTSIDIRLRYNIAVGFINASPNDIVGNSSGNPPACQTPRFTASATRRKCALQLVSSLQLLEIPITGRPLKTSSVKPSVLTHARCRNPSTSRRPNQFSLLYITAILASKTAGRYANGAPRCAGVLLGPQTDVHRDGRCPSLPLRVLGMRGFPSLR